MKEIIVASEVIIISLNLCDVFLSKLLFILFSHCLAQGLLCLWNSSSNTLGCFFLVASRWLC